MSAGYTQDAMDLLQRYLDAELPDAEQSRLFAELSVNDALRRDYNAMMTVRDELRRDLITPPVDVESEVLAALSAMEPLPAVALSSLRLKSGLFGVGVGVFATLLFLWFSVNTTRQDDQSAGRQTLSQAPSSQVLTENPSSASRGQMSGSSTASTESTTSTRHHNGDQQHADRTDHGQLSHADHGITSSDDGAHADNVTNARVMHVAHSLSSHRNATEPNITRRSITARTPAGGVVSGSSSTHANIDALPETKSVETTSSRDSRDASSLSENGRIGSQSLTTQNDSPAHGKQTDGGNAQTSTQGSANGNEPPSSSMASAAASRQATTSNVSATTTLNHSHDADEVSSASPSLSSDNSSSLSSMQREPVVHRSLALEVRSFSMRSYPDVALASLSQPPINNVALGLVKSFGEDHRVGVEIGQESILQNYGTTMNARPVNVEQNTLAWWAAVLYEYSPQSLKVGDLRPFARVTAGAARIGPMGRFMLGARYDILDNIGIMLSGEAMELLSQQDGTAVTSSKIGFSGGLSIRF